VFAKFRALVLGGCQTTMRLKKTFTMSYMPYNQIWLNPHMDSLPMWLHHKSEKKSTLLPILLLYCVITMKFGRCRSSIFLKNLLFVDLYFPIQLWWETKCMDIIILRKSST
jgi:hypothetical protein